MLRNIRMLLLANWPLVLFLLLLFGPEAYHSAKDFFAPSSIGPLPLQRIDPLDILYISLAVSVFYLLREPEE